MSSLANSVRVVAPQDIYVVYSYNVETPLAMYCDEQWYVARDSTVMNGITRRHLRSVLRGIGSVPHEEVTELTVEKIRMFLVALFAGTEPYHRVAGDRDDIA